MKRSDKHHERALKLEFNEFSGGEVYDVAAESLENNQVQVLRNFDFDAVTGHPKTILPFEEYCDVGTDIDDVFFDPLLNYFLAVCGTSLKKIPVSSGAVVSVTGALSSTKDPSFALWDQPAKVLIASGGKLQTYDGTTLDTVSTSPNCDIVFVRGVAGRVVVARSGYDKLIYSAVGDCESADAWTDTPEDDATSKELEVGYKDSGDIVGIQPMPNDLVVFKSNGSIYRIIGEYDSWSVTETLSKIPLIARDAAIRAGNDIIFLTSGGLRSLSVVDQYGDMLQKTVSENVDRYLSSVVSSKARVWHLPSKGQLLINPNGSTKALILHLGGARNWSHMTFASNITKVFEYGGKTYLVSGKKIYRQSTPSSTTTPVHSVMKMKKSVFDNDVVLKRIVLNIQPTYASSGALMVAGASMPFTASTGADIAYLDTDEAFSDTDPLHVSGEKSMEKRCNIRTNILEPELIVTDGAISVRKITLYYAEG